jgi:hypothetical protein
MIGNRASGEAILPSTFYLGRAVCRELKTRNGNRHFVRPFLCMFENADGSSVTPPLLSVP